MLDKLTSTSYLMVRGGSPEGGPSGSLLHLAPVSYTAYRRRPHFSSDGTEVPYDAFRQKALRRLVLFAVPRWRVRDSSSRTSHPRRKAHGHRGAGRSGGDSRRDRGDLEPRAARRPEIHD